MQLPSIRSVCSTLPRLAATLVLAAATLVPLAASAVPITLPSGLNPGDQYRLAFVTSTFRDATSSNIADYNTFVTGVANTVPELAALGTSWSAIASTLSIDARDNTMTNPSLNGTGVPIFLLNDTKLADNNTDLWDGTIDTVFGITESGLPVPLFDSVWTGSRQDGSGAAQSSLGSPLCIAASSGCTAGRTFFFTDSQWIDSDLLDARQVNAVYALSAPLTAIPEPGTATLLALGLVAVGISRRKL